MSYEIIGLNIMLWCYLGSLAYAYACGRVDGAKAAYRALGREDLAEKLP